jgi:hypothetical protein
MQATTFGSDTYLPRLKLLYEIPISDISFVPPVAGVYVLSDFNRVYCGCSEALNRRFPETLREQGFGHYFNYLSEELLDLPSGDLKMACLSCLEKNTISALNTIIYGNGLPLHLTNKKDVTWLPALAWEKDTLIEYQLAIDIAQTVLFGIGVPLHMTNLPYYGIFRTHLPRLMHEFNTSNWEGIVNAESAARQREECLQPPMFVIHPA